MSFLLNGLEWSEAAVLVSETQSVTNFEASKLLGTQPSDLFRAPDLGADIKATYTLSNDSRSVNCMSMLYHNGSTKGSIRWQLADSEANLDTDANNLFDSALGFGTRLRFPGDGISTIPALAARGVSGSFSIELYCTFEPGFTDMGIVRLHGGTGQEAQIFVDSANRFVFRSFKSGQGVSGVVLSSAKIAGVRYHVACVFNTITNTSEIYVDGVLEGVTTGVTTDMCDGDAIDLGYQTGAFFFKGSIDDLRIWKVALSIAAIALGRLVEVPVGFYPAMFGYYRFNERRGTAFFDDVNAVNDGVVGPNNFEYPDLLITRPVDFLAAPLFDSRWLWAHQYTVSDASISAQWLRFEVLDSANPAGQFTAGVMGVGDAFIPQRSWGTGSTPYGFIDTSVFAESAGGQTFVRNRPIKRKVILSYRQQVADTDFYSLENWYNLNYFRGGSKPILVVVDTNSARVQENTIYGLMNLEVSIRNSAYRMAEQIFSVTELV